MVKILLATGEGKVNSIEAECGGMPLLFAAAYGQLVVAKLLIENGAGLEWRDRKYNSTAISWAA